MDYKVLWENRRNVTRKTKRLFNFQNVFFFFKGDETSLSPSLLAFEFDGARTTVYPDNFVLAFSGVFFNVVSLTSYQDSILYKQSRRYLSTSTE